MLLPPHHPHLNLHTIQDPPFDGPETSTVPIVDIHALEGSMRTREVNILKQLPHYHDLTWVQRNLIRYRPHEAETVQAMRSFPNTMADR